MAHCDTHNITFDPNSEWCVYCGKPEPKFNINCVPIHTPGCQCDWCKSAWITPEKPLSGSSAW